MLNIGELEKMYQDAEEADAEAFAEMRSNIMLISGEHYAKKGSKLWQRIRDDKGIADEVKIRLTKNHIQRIVKTYVNNLVAYAPGVAIMPRNESEIQDQKSAELNKAVWNFAKSEQDLDEKIEDWSDDFMGIGEVATKIFWDPMGGPVVAYKQKVNKAGENVYLDAGGKETTDAGLNPETGEATNQPAQGEPVFRGALTFEDVYGFNLLRPKGCKNLKKAPWLGIRKMVEVDVVKSWCNGNEEKLKYVKEEEDKTYHVFDSSRAEYGSTNGQILIKEYYWRPCHKYPQGWFVISTSFGKLFEGELPFGKFPIVVKPCEKVQTTPRGRAIVNVLRPYQVEINRAASKMAEHQITLGDDKVLIQKGTQLSQGGVLPGVRGVTYSGKEPVVLTGRSGEQYLNYMLSQIEEMYKVAMLEEEVAEKQDGQADAWAMLFKSARQKKKFVRYVRRFEAFLIEVCKLYLELAKHYFTDDMLVPAIGRNEYINIEEFRNSDPICYQIKLEAQSDDIETKFGKLLSINHTLQYVGNKMEREDIGKMLRAMPYANQEESFKDFTLDYDTATNIILALDRGQMPKFNKNGDHKYILRRLEQRMQQADFETLPPATQMAYEQRKAQHEQVMAEQAAEIQRAQAGFIPTDGYMVTVDLYVSDPKDPNKTKRARLPYSSVLWLIKRLEQQGLAQDALSNIEMQTQASIARRMTGSGTTDPRVEGIMRAAGMGNAMPGGATNGTHESRPTQGQGSGNPFGGASVRQPVFAGGAPDPSNLVRN